MSVILRRPSDLPEATAYDCWIVVDDSAHAAPAEKKAPDIGRRLEAAFTAIGPDWWALGKTLAAERSARVAHMPTCGAYGSDFGLMLAWARLIEAFSKAEDRTLVVCNDPWAFRHFAAMDGVEAGAPPPLAGVRCKRRLRGILARVKVTAGVVRAAWATRYFARHQSAGDPVILVYGHPASRADGYDDYFGDLMTWHPGLKRMLHTDCPAGRARELAEDGRTASLHAYGSALFALTLPFVAWRPGRAHRTGPYGWLIRRAAAIENSGGGPAMNAWQQHCQRNWMTYARPSIVLWPWENHGWERALSRVAKTAGVPTVGYQHTTIGPYQFNYSPRCNPDPEQELPDLVVANGPATYGEMADWAVPEDSLVIGGTFRLPPFERSPYDPDGVVFVPLSANPRATAAQIDAAQVLAAAGFAVRVKEHPMYPADFVETERLKRTDQGLADLGVVRALVYATGTMGLQGLLAGVPTIRLTMDDRFGMNVLPKKAVPVEATPDTLLDTVRNARPAPLAWGDILAAIDRDLWRDLIQSVKTTSDLAAVSRAAKDREAETP